MIRFKLSPFNEFLLVAGMGLILILLILIDVGSEALLPFLIRIGLSLFFLLFVSGFLLQIALFPGRDDLNGVERLTLSLALSLASIPPTGLVLDRLPGLNINTPSMVMIEILLVGALLLVIRFRRRNIPEDERFMIRMDFDARAWWARQDFPSRFLYVLLAAALIIALVTTVIIVAGSGNRQQITEFYILGPVGLAEDFPRSATINQSVAVTVGVANKEGKTTSYSIEVRSDNQLIGSAEPFQLDDHESLEQLITFTPIDANPNALIEFLLYRDGSPEVYRELHLWMAVES